MFIQQRKYNGRRGTPRQDRSAGVGKFRKAALTTAKSASPRVNGHLRLGQPRAKCARTGLMHGCAAYPASGALISEDLRLYRKPAIVFCLAAGKQTSSMLV